MLAIIVDRALSGFLIFPRA